MVDATLDGVPYRIVLGIGDSCIGVSGNGMSVELCGVDVCGFILCGDRERVNGEVNECKYHGTLMPMGVSISVASGLSPPECLDRDLLQLLFGVPIGVIIGSMYPSSTSICISGLRNCIEFIPTADAAIGEGAGGGGGGGTGCTPATSTGSCASSPSCPRR